mmetsp:Transcript_56282/g.164498  ORF Transcript_56282/g.164498 Transcript_56282/m.164498 type:complete len:218 (-) Transcript_56282:384-1037(-)
MNGTTFGNSLKERSSLLLPSMPNRTMLPNTQMVAMYSSTPCRTRFSTKCANELPVTITSSSGCSICAQPFCSSDRLPAPKAASAIPTRIRKASTDDPVKIALPRTLGNLVRLERNHAVPPPRAIPAITVTARRKTLMTNSAPPVTAPELKPVRTPYKTTERVDSKGAQARTSGGNRWSLNLPRNSIILGMTKPSPRGVHTFAKMNPSSGLKLSTQTA